MIGHDDNNYSQSCKDLQQEFIRDSDQFYVKRPPLTSWIYGRPGKLISMMTFDAMDTKELATALFC